MKISIVLLLILTQLSFAGSKYIKAESNFLAASDDKISFIRSQLIYQAIKKILTKEMVNLGYDSKLFWERYDLKFEEYFTKVKTGLEEKYKVGKEEQTEKEKEEFIKVSRQSRLIEKSKYKSISKALSKYAVTKRMSRTSSNPNMRVIELKGVVDKYFLGKLYKNIMDQGHLTKFNKLYITPIISIKDMTWESVKVENPAEFLKVISGHWRSWFAKNYPDYFDEILLTDSGDETSLRKHLAIPEELVANDSSHDYKNSLWVKIEIQIAKISEGKEFNDITLGSQGKFIIFNLNNNRSMAHRDFPSVTDKYRLSSIENFENVLANNIYRVPLEKLGDFSGVIRSTNQNEKFQKVELIGYQNISHVFSFMSTLKDKGVRLRVNSLISHYEGSKAILSVRYTGGEDSFKKFLQGLKNEETDSKSVIKFANEDLPYSINLELKKEEKKEANTPKQSASL